MCNLVGLEAMLAAAKFECHFLLEVVLQVAQATFKRPL